MRSGVENLLVNEVWEWSETVSGDVEQVPEVERALVNVGKRSCLLGINLRELKELRVGLEIVLIWQLGLVVIEGVNEVSAGNLSLGLVVKRVVRGLQGLLYRWKLHGVMCLHRLWRRDLLRWLRRL